jgi:hypothetical protein
VKPFLLRAILTPCLGNNLKSARHGSAAGHPLGTVRATAAGISEDVTA